MFGEDFGEKMPPVVGLVGSNIALHFSDPELVNELYTIKNKYFDKHHFTYLLAKPLLGESILLVTSSKEWSNKRKALSAAFYKEKLLKMVEIVKE